MFGGGDGRMVEKGAISLRGPGRRVHVFVFIIIIITTTCTLDGGTVMF
jgi:hypothetical protein